MKRSAAGVRSELTKTVREYVEGLQVPELDRWIARLQSLRSELKAAEARRRRIDAAEIEGR